MEILVILLMLGLAVLFAKTRNPDKERIDKIEERINEVGEQVADFMLDR